MEQEQNVANVSMQTHIGRKAMVPVCSHDQTLSDGIKKMVNI